jgi:hypothetical protein
MNRRAHPVADHSGRPARTQRVFDGIVASYIHAISGRTARRRNRSRLELATDVHE